MTPARSSRIDPTRLEVAFTSSWKCERAARLWSSPPLLLGVSELAVSVATGRFGDTSVGDRAVRLVNELLGQRNDKKKHEKQSWDRGQMEKLLSNI